MKRIIALLLSLLIGVQGVYADACGQKLTGIFSPEKAAAFCKVFGTGGIPLNNNTYLIARNAANTANINMIKVDATDDLVINADSGDVIKINPNAVLDITISAGNMAVVTDGWSITSSGTTAKSVSFCGGVTCSGGSGSKLTVYGNTESGNPGAATLTGGSVSTGHINLVTGNASAAIIQKPNGTTQVTTLPTGVTQVAGDYNFGTLGTVAIQEATAGSACSGTLTANGATPVVTSTTCATTGSRIFLQRTGAETGTVNAWISAISTGVSFSITSEAADTGAYNWIIFHEAP